MPQKKRDNIKKGLMTLGRKRQFRGGSIERLALVLIILAGTIALQPQEIEAANLGQKTINAYNHYVQVAESQMGNGKSGDFLYLDRLPKSKRDEIVKAIKQNEVSIEHLQTRDRKGKEINVPGGMVHHWLGIIFIPGQSLDSALQVLRDYDNYKNIYKPQVLRSKLISHQDDHYQMYMRVQEKTIVTATLDTWADVQFTEIDENRGESRSVSTRIQQVEDAGTPQEHLDPVGHDSGYLWRINSYWRYEEEDDGVIIEWESISLSRPIPFMLTWLVRPLIRRIAQNTINDMLTATRNAVLAEKAQQKAKFKQ